MNIGSGARVYVSFSRFICVYIIAGCVRVCMSSTDVQVLCRCARVYVYLRSCLCMVSENILLVLNTERERDKEKIKIKWKQDISVSGAQQVSLWSMCYTNKNAFHIRTDYVYRWNRMNICDDVHFFVFYLYNNFVMCVQIHDQQNWPNVRANKIEMETLRLCVIEMQRENESL